MVTRSFRGLGLLLVVGALLSGAFLNGACLSSPANDYLYTCANGQSCPTGTSCASDHLCHSTYVAGAGPADAGAYLCATSSPECPDGQSCDTNGLCSGPDAGSTELPDAGDAGNTKSCDLATAFPSSSPVSCGTDCSGLAVGDFNHDGYADVVVSVDPDSTDKGGLSVLLNDGSGMLGAPTTTRSLYPCGDPSEEEWTSPDALAVADFNGDGWPDLGLSITQSSQLALAINDQHGGFTVGGFQPGMSPNCGETGYSAISAYQAAGDWYLAALGYGINDSNGVSVVAVSRVESNGTGIDPFTLLEPAPGYTPIGVTVGPFANDPLPSAAVSEEDLDTAAGQIELFYGTQSGNQDRLSSPSSQTLICQEGTNQIASADLNGDGLLDLVTVNFTSSTLEIFYAKDGGFKPGVSFATNIGDAGLQPVGAVVADLDGDGRADIATVNAGSISIFKGLTDGGFLLVAIPATTSPVPYWISAVDLEGQNANDGGLPDLVVGYLSGSASNAIDVFYNGCR